MTSGVRGSWNQSVAPKADPCTGGTAAPTIIAYHEHDYIEASLSFLAEDELRGMIETTLGLMEKSEDGKLLQEDELKKDASYALVRTLPVHGSDVVAD